MPKIASKKNIVILRSPVNARIVDPDREIRLAVSEMLSFEIAGAGFQSGSSFGMRSSFYKFATDSFPAGFTRLVTKRLERAGHNVTVRSKPAPPPLGPENPVVDSFPYDSRYDYQPETMRRLIILKAMIARVATGGGKSRIFKLCAERIGRPTLFCTTRKTLMYQMADAYKEDLKKEVGIIGDGIFKPIPDGVNFAIIDTLASHLNHDEEAAIMARLKEDYIVKREVIIDRALEKRGFPTCVDMQIKLPIKAKREMQKIRKLVIDKRPVPLEALRLKAARKYKALVERRQRMIDFLRGIEFVCLEEAHEASSESYYSVMRTCINAHYRLALTGTPFMREDEEANMRLMACSGPVGIVVTEKQLIDCGILATPYFKIRPYGRPTMVHRTTSWQRAYAFGIVDSPTRNAGIIEECLSAKAYGLPTLILIQHTMHGKILVKSLKEVGINAKFISGESKQVTRKRELDRLASGEIDALIGSTILDVGVDVPAVGKVILAGAGKAEVAFRQRVGRGMRAKKSGPNVIFIVDFDDVHNKHLRLHSKHRRSFIDETPGFRENVVSVFDYEGLGLKKVS